MSPRGPDRVDVYLAALIAAKLASPQLEDLSWWAVGGLAVLFAFVANFIDAFAESIVRKPLRRTEWGRDLSEEILRK